MAWPTVWLVIWYHLNKSQREAWLIGPNCSLGLQETLVMKNMLPMAQATYSKYNNLHVLYVTKKLHN